METDWKNFWCGIICIILPNALAMGWILVFKNKKEPIDKYQFQSMANKIEYLQGYVKGLQQSIKELRK